MRIISGKYKGRRLISPHGKVRPTLDMVKGSLFSILQGRGLLDGARCLDIFCGTGGLGIEALSRGAESCTFADVDTSNAKANSDMLGISCRFIRADYRKAVKLLSAERKTFDLIFCDPPYGADFWRDIALRVCDGGILDKNGVIIVEHSSKNDLINAPENCIIERRVFGETALDIITRGDDESDICGSV